MNDFEYTLNKEDEQFKVREVLRRRLNFSSRFMRKLKNGDGVFANGNPIRMNARLVSGDVITVRFPEETSGFEPEDIPIDVLYEDDDLLIINKQPGFVVHPTKGHPSHTIANGIMKYMLDKGDSYKIRFINRLDMDTTGVLVIGKNAFCQDDFSRQASEDKLVKKYAAILKGVISEEEGVIDLPIDKADPDQVKRIVRPDGFPSLTHYKVMERFSGYTLAELEIKTGRTHQIRVHMSHIGYPVAGDILYGGNVPWHIERQALHAKSLAFNHPKTKVPMEITAPLPADMEAFLVELRK